MTDASGALNTPADEGLTPEERRMLETLGASAPAGASAFAKATADESADESGASSRAPTVAGGTPASSAAASSGEFLTPQEEQVLREAREELKRLSRTAARPMFGRDRVVGATSEGLDALLAAASEDDDRGSAEPSAFARSLPGRALATCLDAVNAPFRWLPPAARFGLGLAGVLLLFTLLVVVLVRTLRS